MTISMLPAYPLTASAAAEDMPSLLKAGSISASEDTLTELEPFAPYTGGSQYFRIPALITLEDGSLVAAADARWQTTGDGGGLDTIASVSRDGGLTWNYSFPMFFPDSQGYAGASATTIIDPGIVEGPDGTIYCFADVNPTGSTTAFKEIGAGTGYVTVNGKRYLALTDTYGNVETAPTDTDLSTYAYYVDDFDENGFAQILKREDSTPTGYGVDEWYNLYTVTEDGEYADDLRQAQVNSTTQIQQNVYYKDSLYHVYSIGYIWYVTSKDHGVTWEHPRNINDDVKRRSGEKAILVSPGQGITTRSGDILLGFYDHTNTEASYGENASFIYSNDNGKTWKRTNDIDSGANNVDWTSENEMVELADGTIRMFARNGKGYLCYADATKNENGDYTMGTLVQTSAKVTSTCNVTSISYSQKVDGKQLILVGAPGGNGRANGKIFSFLVQEDNSMELVHTFSVPESASGYCYSCMTELDDGSIGLLWEPSHSAILYDKFSILDIYPNADFANVSLDVTVAVGATWERTCAGSVTISQEPDGEIALAQTNQRTLSITGASEGYTTLIANDILYRVHVTKEHPALSDSCSHGSTSVVGAIPAGCETLGYTGDTVCNACDGIVSAGKPIPATGHDWDDGIVTLDVSVEEDGEKVYTCNNDPFHQKTEILYASAYAPFVNAYDEVYALLSDYGLYTDDTFQTLKHAYDEATFAYISGDESRSALYHYTESLNAALEQLAPKTTETLNAELASAIALAKPLYDAGKGDLSASVWNAFAAAYSSASKADGASNATSLWSLIKDLNDALTTVRAEKDRLTTVAAKALDLAVANAKPLFLAGQGNYTAASWNAFAAAYQAAQTPSAHADDQTLKNLKAALEQARLNLRVDDSLKAGETITIQNLTYQVLNPSSKTVRVKKAANKAAKLTIPATIQIRGISCSVVEIGAKAFAKCSKLKQITIGANITTIKKQSFQNCKKLSKVILKGTKLKTVQSKAFQKTASKVTVKVPAKLKKAQRSALLKKLKKAGMSKKSTCK